MSHDTATLRRIEEARAHHHYPEQRQREAMSRWRISLTRATDRAKRKRLLNQLNRLEAKLGEPLTA